MNQGNDKTRTQVWEDEPPTETPTRRKAQVKPRVRTRVSQTEEGAPAEEADEGVRPEWRKRWAEENEDASRGPWWRPQSTWGRAFLACGVLAVAGGVTAGALALRAYLEHANNFRIAGTANIQAAGLTEVSRADLLPVFGEDIGKNIFFIHLDERKHDLEQIPWIEHATVMRVLPDQLRITVVERKPVAFTQIGQQTGLVDADGVLLTMSAADMAEHHYSFPVVTGLNPNDAPEARRQRMAVYMRLVAELDANHQHNSEQLSEVDLSNPEDAKVKLIEQGSDVTAELGEDRFMERFQRYKAHIGELRQQYPQLAGVDLRYDDQMVLKMGKPAPAEPAPQPAADAPQNMAAVQTPAPASQPVSAAAVKTPAMKTPVMKTPVSLPVSAPAGKIPAKTAAVKTPAAASAKTPARSAAKAEAKPAAKNHAAPAKAASAKSGAAKSGTAKPGVAKPGVKDAKNSTARKPAGKGVEAVAQARNKSAAHREATEKTAHASHEDKGGSAIARLEHIDKQRVEQLRQEQQKKHDAAQHHSAMSADKHRVAPQNSATTAVGTAVEGQ